MRKIYTRKKRCGNIKTYLHTDIKKYIEVTLNISYMPHNATTPFTKHFVANNAYQFEISCLQLGKQLEEVVKVATSTVTYSCAQCN